MIIKENNKKSENRNHLAKLKAMLKNLDIPNNYLLEDWGGYFKIFREYEYIGGLFSSWNEIGRIRLSNNELNIIFDDENEYIDLYNYLENSKLKFNVDVEEDY